MSCAHRQAVEVVVAHGEIVACVCVECFEQLSPHWIAGQLDRALAEAYCPHDRTVDTTMLGMVVPERMCIDCGVML